MKITHTIGRATLALVAVFAIGAHADAQITKKGSGYVLRMKHTKGTKANHGITITMPSPQAGQPGVTITTTIATLVKSVSGDVATIETKSQPMKFSTGGQMGQAQTATVKINSRGKIVDGSAQSLGNSQVMLPEGAIKVGHTWTQENSLALMGAPMKVKAKYKFNGIKTISGKQVADIGVTMTGTGQTSVNGKGTVYLLVSDGALWKMSTDATLTMSGQNGQKTTQKFKVVVQKK